MIRLLSPLNLALVAATVLAAIAGFVLVPAGVELPVHWNVHGEADWFLPRELALILPLGLQLATVVLFALALRFAPSAKSGSAIVGAAITTLLLIGLVVEAVTVLIGTGVPVSMVQAIVGVLAVMLLVVGNALPKSQPNSVAGVRIPSTLADAGNWQATHRLTGALAMISGLALLIAALLLPPGATLFASAIAAVLLPVIVGAVYSLSRARRAKRS
ncbi:MAG: SdpI family protein [Devosia sp.]|nr:SdpI family protein [Devosia sp.]